MICKECDGLGCKALWAGHGGEEYDNGDSERCDSCGGEGEVDD